MTCRQHRSTRKGRMISVEGEHRRRAMFRNPLREEYVVIKVDQGVVEQERAADYAVHKAGVGTLIVELKGGDVRHACRQVASTVDIVGRCEIPHGKIAGLVICTRFPAVDTTIQRLQNDFRRRVGCRLKVSSSQTEFEFADLFS